MSMSSTTPRCRPMPSLQHGRWWWGAGFGMLAAVIGVALLPAPLVEPVTYNDKVAHAAAFAFFMVWFSALVEPRRLVWLAFGLLCYGGLIEGLQALTVTRKADVLDLVADAAGLAIGWFAALAGARHWCHRLETWLGASTR